MELGIYKKLVNKLNSRTESQIILYSSIAIVILFIILVYSVYVAPIGVDKLLCAVLLIIFWYSKADFFWFAFFIIISAYPAGLFTETSIAAVRRLPVFSPIPKISFTVLDIFLILALFKAIVKGKRFKYKDVFKMRNIVLIFPYVFIVSFFYGVTLKLFLNAALRGLFFYTLIYSFPALIHNKKEIYKFMAMFFPFVFIELASQVYTLRTGVNFGDFLNPGSLPEVFNSVTGDIRAIANGYIILRVAYVFAFIFLDNREKLIPKTYNILIILTSLLSVIISATRSAIAMFIFIFVVYFIVVARKKPNIVMQIFIAIVILITTLDFSNVVNLNDIFGASYQRFVGAVSTQGGEFIAEDTFDYRISVRLPKLLDAINNSIFVGYGLSDKYFENYDGHLGGAPIGLLQVGIIGYIAYLLFLFNIFKKCFIYIRKFTEDNSLLISIKVFLVSFFGYSIINFSIDPIFVLNTSALPQDILVLFIIASLFIYYAMREQAIKKIEFRNKVINMA